MSRILIDRDPRDSCFLCLYDDDRTYDYPHFIATIHVDQFSDLFGSQLYQELKSRTLPVRAKFDLELV